MRGPLQNREEIVFANFMEQRYYLLDLTQTKLRFVTFAQRAGRFSFVMEKTDGSGELVTINTLKELQWMFNCGAFNHAFTGHNYGFKTAVELPDQAS